MPKQTRIQRFDECDIDISTISLFVRKRKIRMGGMMYGTSQDCKRLNQWN